MHNPTLIPVLMKDSSIPKGMVYKELNKALPCRIGIEFELAGNFLGNFVAEHPESLNNFKDFICNIAIVIFNNKKYINTFPLWR